MLGAAPDPTTALAGLAVLGSGLSCVLPLVTAAAAATRHGAGATVGLVSVAANSAYLVGPPVVGLAAARAGLATVFLALMVPIVALVLVAGRALGDVPVD
jgi:MFS family permease